MTLPRVSAVPPVADSPTPASTPTVAAAGAPAPTAAPPARPGVWVWAAAAAVFAGLLMIVLAIVSPVFISASRRRIQALELYLGAPVDSRRRVASASPSAVGTQVLQMSERLTQGRDATVRTARLLERADLPLRTNEWYVLRRLRCGRLRCSAGVVLLNGALLLGVLGGLLGGTWAMSCPAWCSRSGLPAGQAVRAAAARRADAAGQQPGHGFLPPAGDRRHRAGCRRARGQGVLPRAGRDEDRRRPRGQPGPAGPADGQRQPPLDHDGHPHPAPGGREPGRDAAHHRDHAARAASRCSGR